jgi:hypothetical protein
MNDDSDLRRREALRRLGAFSVDDKVLFWSGDHADDEEYAIVVETEEARIRVRFTEMAMQRSSGVTEPCFRWTTADHLRHDQSDLRREEALRRLRDPGVHLQTVVEAWAHDAGIVERDGDPLCGATGGKMVRAEARVTCLDCREKMKTLPRAGERR